MNILVIDDTQANLQAAKQVLTDHELTLVATYDEAYKLLEKPRASHEVVEAELQRRGFPAYSISRDMGATLERQKLEERERVEVELCPPPSFDVVLCDLLMPAGREQQGPNGQKYVGQEMPVGWALALMAVLQGAKHVAVVSATNHHDHPAAAMLDRLASGGFHDDEPQPPAKFAVNGVRVEFVNSAPMVGIEGTTCADCGGSGKEAEKQCFWCHGSGKAKTGEDCGSCKGQGHITPQHWPCRGSGKALGKDWGKVLARLLGNG